MSMHVKFSNTIVQYNDFACVLSVLLDEVGKIRMSSRIQISILSTI